MTYIYPNLIIWPISFSISNCTHLVNVHIRCFVPQQQQQLITGSTGTLSLSLSFDDKSTDTNTLKKTQIQVETQIHLKTQLQVKTQIQRNHEDKYSLYAPLS